MKVIVKNELGIYQETYISGISDEIDDSNALNSECNQEFGYKAPDSQEAWVSILPSNKNFHPTNKNLLEESAGSVPISVILKNLKQDEERGIFVDTAESNDFEFLTSDIGYGEYPELETDPLSDPLEVTLKKSKKKRIRLSQTPKKENLKLVISPGDPIWNLLKPIIQNQLGKHDNFFITKEEEPESEQNENLSHTAYGQGKLVKTSPIYPNDSDYSEGNSRQYVRPRKNSSNSDTSPKLAHNQLERIRRAGLKNAILALKATIPDIRNQDRISKVQILQKAVETINYITQKVNIKETVLNLQKKRKELLEAKLARLKETSDHLENYQLDFEINDEIIE